MAHQNEASVEEILESIKKVIARDNRSQVVPIRRNSDQRAADTEPTYETEDEADVGSEEVLELDHALVEGAPVEDNENTVLDGASEAMSNDSDDPNDEPPLVGADAQGAMKENLAALAMLAQPGARPQIVRSGETSLEGMTRELLRPMLAEWLDKNLPGMVEKMVQAEIARIAGKRR